MDNIELKELVNDINVNVALNHTNYSNNFVVKAITPPCNTLTLSIIQITKVLTSLVGLSLDEARTKKQSENISIFIS
jgi:hypothetical protein